MGFNFLSHEHPALNSIGIEYNCIVFNLYWKRIIFVNSLPEQHPFQI